MAANACSMRLSGRCGGFLTDSRRGCRRIGYADATPVSRVARRHGQHAQDSHAVIPRPARHYTAAGPKPGDSGAVAALIQGQRLRDLHTARAGTQKRVRQMSCGTIRAGTFSVPGTRVAPGPEIGLHRSLESPKSVWGRAGCARSRRPAGLVRAAAWRSGSAPGCCGSQCLLSQSLRCSSRRRRWQACLVLL